MQTVSSMANEFRDDFIQPLEVDEEKAFWKNGMMSYIRPAYTSNKSSRLLYIVTGICAALLLAIIIVVSVNNTDVQAEIKKLQASIMNAESQLSFVGKAAKVMDELESLKSTLFLLKCNLDNLMNNITASPTKACCPDGWVYHSMSCYYFSTNGMEWHAARDDCNSKQAMLAVINERSEWEFLISRTVPTYYWIGLTDERTGHWEWVDGTPYTVDPKEWMPGQPDDWKNHGLGGGEDCAHLHRNGKYNDDHCTRLYRFVCEKKLG
ncbi:C-type lectin domain family 10 member A isoform X3 [Acipenser ruthenus]|uniref:C-type lectin domain family 10 member A isoform X3 n=1 Tax=Acipenser ruthenus TaxID=7906 RepID=UPI0027422EFF|nr:C-type lectin domain family 10 member A isoform X3 [Acipenser ruthenus]